MEDISHDQKHLYNIEKVKLSTQVNDRCSLLLKSH